MRSRIAIFAAVLLAAAVPASAGPNPQALLQKADALAWQNAWRRAAPLYAQAEHLFSAQGDQRNALYARISNLRGQLPTLPVPQVSEQLSEYLDNPLVESDARLRLRCLVVKGETDTDLDPFLAAKSWREALAVATTLHEAGWANRARGELGLLAFLQGNINDAVIQLGSALKVAQATGDVPAQIRWLTIYGLGFVQLGKASQALTFYDRALKLAGPTPVNFPLMTYTGEGEALAQLGRFSDAERVLGLALQQAEARSAFGFEAELTMSLAEMALQQRQVERASTLFTKADALARRAGSGAIQAETALDLGGLELKAGHVTAADRTLTDGAQAARTMEERMLLPKVLAQLAEVRLAEGKYEGARNVLDEANDILEGLLLHVSSPWVEGQLIGAMNDIVAARIRLAGSRTQDPRRLFDVVEEARGRSLWDMLVARSVADVQPSPALRRLEGKTDALQARLFHTQDASSRQDLLDQIFLTEQAMAPASTVLLERSRALGNRRRRVTLSGLQRALRPGELFVEFALDEPHSFAIVASRRATAIRALPSRTEIERAAKALVAQIQSGSDNTPAGQALGAMLLGAIPELADHQRLIVSTDGALNQVPFEVLGDAGGRQLLAAHVLTYVPSASVLVFLRNRRSVVPRRPALVVSGSSAGSKVAQTDGDAIRAGKQIDRGIYDLNGATLAPLPSAADEARFVAATLSGSGTTLLLGDAATEGNFKRQPLEEYRVLHFAVHGVMSTRFPDRSALLLRPNTDDDGLLQAREILGLRLNADLVTLSACDTGNGATYGEDGVASLVRPFFVAGARAVVANLWNADDTFSLALMKAFYRHLAGGEDAGMALRDAKLDMQQEFGPEAVPKLWSGFLMYGDGSTPVVSRSGASR